MAMNKGGYAESDIGLPPLIDHRDYATLREWLEVLYWQYLAIVGGNIRPLGKPITARGPVCADGRDEVFWHVITSGSGRHAGGGHRQLAPGRAARLGQAWHLLELLAADDIRAVWWRENWGGGDRLCVSTVDFRLLVVLQESRQHLSLVTVFPLGRRHRGRYLADDAAAWESGARVVPARRSLPGPYHSPDAIERHRCWM